MKVTKVFDSPKFALVKYYNDKEGEVIPVEYIHDFAPKNSKDFKIGKFYKARAINVVNNTEKDSLSLVGLDLFVESKCHIFRLGDEDDLRMRLSKMRFTFPPKKFLSPVTLETKNATKPSGKSKDDASQKAAATMQKEIFNSYMDECSSRRRSLFNFSDVSEEDDDEEFISTSEKLKIQKIKEENLELKSENLLLKDKIEQLEHQITELEERDLIKEGSRLCSFQEVKDSVESVIIKHERNIYNILKEVQNNMPSQTGSSSTVKRIPAGANIRSPSIQKPPENCLTPSSQTSTSVCSDEITVTPSSSRVPRELMQISMTADENVDVMDISSDQPEFLQEIGNDVHLGAGVLIPKEQWTYLLEKEKDTLFISDLAVSVFGARTLANSSVTGKKSNRYLKSEGDPKPALCVSRKKVLDDCYNYYLERAGGQQKSKKDTAKIVNQILALKMKNLRRKLEPSPKI